MATQTSRSSVLVLCSDDHLRQSLGDLLVAHGHEVSFDQRPDSSISVVVTAWDAWPTGWSLTRLRSSFRRVPCLMLSGSPLAGDFAVAQLPRGYFVRLPALPSEIVGLVSELSAA
jgi:hypothetical protein